MNKFDSYRRKFLALVGITSATAASSLAVPHLILRQAHAKPDDEAITDKIRWGLLIDVNKLTDGGDACVTACQKVKVTKKDSGDSFSLPIMCQHCETAPCVDVCPTGASMKRADGIVQVDKHICIGCRYCMMACPYKARSFVHETLVDQRPNTPRGKGTVESCNLCVHRVDKGKNPACVDADPEAIMFGDLNDPESAISKALKENDTTQIRADLGLNTGVRYQGI